MLAEADYPHVEYKRVYVIYAQSYYLDSNKWLVQHVSSRYN